MYEFFKTIHLVGVVVLLGNVTITSFWKLFSDWTKNPTVIAHAQRSVTVADWIFTLSGIVLIIGGGFGATYVQDIPPFEPGWILTGEILFGISGSIWLFVLVPIQIRQAQDARLFGRDGVIPERYWQDSRKWLVWGIVATIPLVAATYVMTAKTCPYPSDVFGAFHFC